MSLINRLGQVPERQLCGKDERPPSETRAARRLCLQTRTRSTTLRYAAYATGGSPTLHGSRLLSLSLAKARHGGRSMHALTMQMSKGTMVNWWSCYCILLVLPLLKSYGCKSDYQHWKLDYTEAYGDSQEQKTTLKKLKRVLKREK
jgi:hypothetical protein